jgi:hypothetical protein
LSVSFRLLVGLPSFNEADTIAKVSTDIDAALASLPYDVEALLVNADNSSTDGTTEAFLASPTESPKQVVLTPHASGKGSNWRALLELVRDQSFDAALLVDSDLAEVPASWVHALVSAVRDGADFCFPLRPPTWNGGDLTYQLAYPVIAGVFGADLREPLCGDIAVSRHGVERVLAEKWTPDELRFGVDTVVASIAVTQDWRLAAVESRRRNKLRSFYIAATGEYRMGDKFAEVVRALKHRVARRTQLPAPDLFHESPMPTPHGNGLPVPLDDSDIARLAESTSCRLCGDLATDSFSVFPDPLQKQLAQHIGSGDIIHGLPWALWRDCLLAWFHPNSDQQATDSVKLVETLFLSRVVGHHREIAGRADWYGSVRDQAKDLFGHRLSLWAPGQWQKPQD